MFKTFDETEKDTIKRLVSEKKVGNPILLGNVLDSLFPNQYIKIDKTKSTVEIMYANTNRTSKVAKDQEILASIILLMSYLEKNGYICLFDCANIQSTTSTIGQGAQNVCTIPYSFPDKNVSSWLLMNCDKQIIVGCDLVDLVTNKFICKEELRFRKQQKCTWTSIILSFLIGLGSIIVAFVTSCCC